MHMELPAAGVELRGVTCTQKMKCKGFATAVQFYRLCKLAFNYNSLFQGGPTFYSLGPKIVFPLDPRAKKVCLTLLIVFIIFNTTLFRNEK
jgi:hypothetical protein